MQKYAKFGVAMSGAILIAINEFAGINIGVEAATVWNVVVTVLTAVGVFAVPNATD